MRIFLTGGSRGIGRALVDQLAAEHELWLLGRDEAAMTVLADSLPRAHAVIGDLADPEAAAAAVAELPPMDAAVHVAGLGGLAEVSALTAEVQQKMFDVNLHSPVLLTQALLPGLRETRGIVIFVNSTAAIRSREGWSAYASSKAALRSFADVLREEEGPRGVRVSTVLPGRTASDMQEGIAAAEGRDYRPDLILPAESVASAIRFAFELPPTGLVSELRIEPVRR
ncbi:SDR family oxidoreductase [Parenemella sanctibonifatiensis]|uniref:Short chain dehydrogenase n=1 Tax=Parenemella sanctibonifatiensis TaxID=2016505 RepID=A0A255EIN8_9ACTN|nr:SDR family oxidoreductase [Parenemella sanctibonifatiensis]OYN91110.1 short chain dehydrogenase [Parenemella sanctibonifatiensis]